MYFNFYCIMLSQLRRVAASQTFARAFSSTTSLARDAGTVKFYNTQRGFGFVQPDDGGSDLFFHASGIRGAEMGKYHSAEDDTRVEYDIGEDPRGARAIDVSLEGGDEFNISYGFSRDGDRNGGRGGGRGSDGGW